MPLPTGPWARLIIYSYNDEGVWTNTIWFHTTTTVPGTFDVQTAVNDFSAHLITAFAHPLQITSGGVKGMRLYVNNGTYTVGADSTTSQIGNEASGELPTEMCVVVQLRTNNTGPSGRGRIFLSGVCEDNTTVSDLNGTGHTLYQAIVTALTGTITAGAVPWVTALFSRKLNSITPCSFIRLDRELAQQKRRKPSF